MANIKISALPTLTTVINTTVIPVVDASVSQQTTALTLKNYILNGSILTGQLSSTLSNNPDTGAGQIYLSGSTGNRIDYAPVGLNTPTLTARSVGTKITLWPALDTSGVDYAIGTENNAIWTSVYDSSKSFKWYAGSTNIMALSGTGVLTTTMFNGVHNGTVGVGAGATPAAASFTTVTSTTSLLVSGNGGIGYTTGAGGTATQASTSGKSTTVILNAPTGQITLNNEILNNASIVSFVLTNSTIAITDLIIVTHRAVGTLGAYGVTATPSNGSATIYIRNNSTTPLAEAIVLQFAIIKSTIS